MIFPSAICWAKQEPSQWSWVFFIQIKKKTREDDKWEKLRPQVVNAPSWTQGFLYLRGNYVPHTKVFYNAIKTSEYMFQMQMVAKECALERSGWLLSCEDSQNGRPRSIQELSAWKSPPWGCLLRSPRCICEFLAKCVGKIFPWDKLQPIDIARILWCSRASEGSCARIRLKATIFALKSCNKILKRIFFQDWVQRLKKIFPTFLETKNAKGKLWLLWLVVQGKYFVLARVKLNLC